MSDNDEQPPPLSPGLDPAPLLPVYVRRGSSDIRKNCKILLGVAGFFGARKNDVARSVVEEVTHSVDPFSNRNDLTFMITTAGVQHQVVVSTTLGPDVAHESRLGLDDRWRPAAESNGSLTFALVVSTKDPLKPARKLAVEVLLDGVLAAVSSFQLHPRLVAAKPALQQQQQLKTPPTGDDKPALQQQQQLEEPPAKRQRLNSASESSTVASKPVQQKQEPPAKRPRLDLTSESPTVAAKPVQQNPPAKRESLDLTTKILSGSGRPTEMPSVIIKFPVATAAPVKDDDDPEGIICPRLKKLVQEKLGNMIIHTPEGKETVLKFMLRIGFCNFEEARYATEDILVKYGMKEVQVKRFLDTFVSARARGWKQTLIFFFLLSFFSARPSSRSFFDFLPLFFVCFVVIKIKIGFQL
jgi:hypothetical protein